MKRWRGLVSLVTSAVDAGSSGVERVQLQTAKRTFDILEAIPAVAPTAKVVHLIHDLWVSHVHVTIRVVNGVVGAGVDAALAIAEERTAVRDDPGARESGSREDAGG